MPTPNLGDPFYRFASPDPAPSTLTPCARPGLCPHGEEADIKMRESLRLIQKRAHQRQPPVDDPS